LIGYLTSIVLITPNKDKEKSFYGVWFQKKRKGKIEGLEKKTKKQNFKKKEELAPPRLSS
jgi:hypothetical protein